MVLDPSPPPLCNTQPSDNGVYTSYRVHCVLRVNCDTQSTQCYTVYTVYSLYHRVHSPYVIHMYTPHVYTPHAHTTCTLCHRAHAHATGCTSTPYRMWSVSTVRLYTSAYCCSSVLCLKDYTMDYECIVRRQCAAACCSVLQRVAVLQCTLSQRLYDGL